MHNGGSRRFKHHQNSTRRHPERDRKSENGSGRGKKERNFGLPTLRAPPFLPTLAPHPSAPQPFGAPIFGFGLHPLGHHHDTHQIQKWRGPKWIAQNWIGQNWLWSKLIKSGWPKRDWPVSVPSGDCAGGERGNLNIEVWVENSILELRSSKMKL